MEIEKSALLVALTLAGWITLALFFEKRGDPRVNRPFAALLLMLCVPLAYFYSHTLSTGPVMWLGQLALAGIWSKGPMLRVLTGAAVGSPLAAAWLHFVPFVLAMLIMPILPRWSEIFGSMGLCHALIYQAMSIRLLVIQRARLARIYQGYPNSAFYWLLFVIAGLAVIMVLDFVLMGLGFTRGQLPLRPIGLATLSITGYMLLIALCSLYRPHVFFSMAMAENYNSQFPPPECQNKVIRAQPARQARELTFEVAHQLTDKLHTVMSKQRLYLSPHLTLSALADAIDATTHQTSELLNVHMSTNFYDYINSLRLEHAESLLLNKKCALRIIDIAYQSGFNNKNSFYRLFRDKHDMPPAEYRAKRQKSEVTLASTWSGSTENDQRTETAD